MFPQKRMVNIMNKTNNPALIYTILSKLPKSRDGLHIKMHLLVLKHDPENTGPHFEAFVIKKWGRNLYCLVRNLQYPDLIGIEDVPPESFEDSDIYYSVYDKDKYPDVSKACKALRTLA